MAWGSLWQVESIKSMFLEKMLPQFTIRGVACFKFFIHLRCVHELLSKVFSCIGSTSKVIYLVVGVCFLSAVIQGRRKSYHSASIILMRRH